LEDSELEGRLKKKMMRCQYLDHTGRRPKRAKREWYANERLPISGTKSVDLLVKEGITSFVTLPGLMSWRKECGQQRPGCALNKIGNEVGLRGGMRETKLTDTGDE
jgi:hypothetical protein